MNDADLMLPGEFGAATRLSSKALRLYAEQGLLVPAGIDPATAATTVTRFPVLG